MGKEMGLEPRTVRMCAPLGYLMVTEGKLDGQFKI